MKKTLLLLTLCGAAFLPAASRAQTFVNPESVEYDSGTKTYYVSNVNNGTIVKANAKGQITGTLKAGLNGPFGLKLHKGILYFADINAVKGINPGTGALVFSVAIAGIGSGQYLNDIEIDSKDFLYVTFTGGARIFKVNLNTKTYTTFVTSNIGSPNGLLLEESNNRLLLNSYRTNSPIQAISLSDSSVSTVKATNLSVMDGFVRDKDGNYYVSAWSQGAVYRFDANFANAPVLVKSGLNGPADMFYNPLTDTIVVPLYSANKLEFISLKTVTGIREAAVIKGLSCSVFPNPASDKLSIRYTLDEKGAVSIQLVSMAGHVSELMQEEQVAGEHELSINLQGKGLAKGVYLLRLRSGQQAEEKGLVIE